MTRLKHLIPVEGVRFTDLNRIYAILIQFKVAMVFLLGAFGCSGLGYETLQLTASPFAAVAVGVSFGIAFLCLVVFLVYSSFKRRIREIVEDSKLDKFTSQPRIVSIDLSLMS